MTRPWAVTILAGLILAATAACGSSTIHPPAPSLGTVVNLTVPPDIANLPLTKANGTTTTWPPITASR